MTAIGNIISSPVNKGISSVDKNTEENAAIAEVFAGIMQQSQEGFVQSDSKDTTDDVLNLTGRIESGSDSNLDRDVANLRTSKKVESKPTENKDSSNQKIADKVENVKTTAKEVKDAVKETYGLSDDEIESALAVLGLTDLDLLDTKNLVALVKEITGIEDVSALLTDSNFKDLFAQVNQMINNLYTSENIDANDLSEIVSIMEEVSASEEVPVEIATEIDADANLSTSEDHTVDTESADNQVNNQMIQDANATADTLNTQNSSELVDAKPTDNDVRDARMEATAEKTDVNSQNEINTSTDKSSTSEDNDEEASGNFGNSNRELGSKSQITKSEDTFESKSDTTANTEKDANDSKSDFSFSFNSTHESPTVANESPVMDIAQPAYTYEDIQNLMDQVNGMIRSFHGTDETTIQMQLNPENLGRIFMSVTEKEGVVTAQLTTTSEEAKNMLQTQLVELRSSLQLQGIKVEAVEVNVATHEFEQNLEKGDSTGREMSERQQRESYDDGNQGHRRNISLDNLDALQGVMSEEEAIVASMMRTNGQTVDYTA